MAGSAANTTRNNPLREVFQRPIGAAVDLIDARAPWITPDGITVSGTLGVLAVDFLIAGRPNNSPALNAAHAALNVTDILDGGLARKRAEDRGIETTNKGAILDTLSDKLQEFAVFAALSQKAAKNGNNGASTVHLLAGMSSVMPALFRSRAEASGGIVKEGGLGTRPVRALMGIAALSASNRPCVSAAISGATFFMNTTTSVRRSLATNPDSKHRIDEIKDPAQIAASKQKHRILQAAAAVSTAAGVKLLISRRRNHGRDTE